MKYLVEARVKPDCVRELLAAIDLETLGQGSVAGGEYLRVMNQARLREDGTVCWIEVCFCANPLAEERPYWEEFFELERITDAHPRENCLDENGKDPHACMACDCTDSLQEEISGRGEPFVPAIRKRICKKP